MNTESTYLYEKPDGVWFPEKGTPIQAPKQIGRNEPCPCGSKKKYKKCCLLKEEQEKIEFQEWLKHDTAIGQQNLREYIARMQEEIEFQKRLKHDTGI